MMRRCAYFSIATFAAGHRASQTINLDLQAAPPTSAPEDSKIVDYKEEEIITSDENVVEEVTGEAKIAQQEADLMMVNDHDLEREKVVDAEVLESVGDATPSLDLEELAEEMVVEVVAEEEVSEAEVVSHENQSSMRPAAGAFTWDRYEYLKTPEGAVTVMELLKKASINHPDKPAFYTPHTNDDGSLVEMPNTAENELKHKYTMTTWGEYYLDVQQMARAFVAAGLKPLDAVNIQGANSREWLVTFLGCIAAGGMPVGLYPTDSPSSLAWKAKDSKAKFIVLARVKDFEGKYQNIDDEDALGSVTSFIIWDKRMNVKGKFADKVVSWQNFFRQGNVADAELASEISEEVIKRTASLKPGQVASVVYTSGTTGNAKGVMLSHDSITFSARTITEKVMTKIPEDGQFRIVSYLPLNHVAGQMMDIFGPLYLSSQKDSYVTLFFPAPCYLRGLCTTKQLSDAAPTVFLGVPMVWDKIKTKLEAKSEEEVWAEVAKKADQKLYEKAWYFGSWGSKIYRGVATSSWQKSVLKKLGVNSIGDLVKKFMGLHKVMYAVSGAGAISPSTVQFFKSRGINILNMYGSSESCAVGTAWTNEDFAKYIDVELGSLGKPMVFGGVQLISESESGEKTDTPEGEQGEIQIQGRNVMMGYLNNEQKTRSAFSEDGWLQTGDIGTATSRGFVHFAGRLKDQFKSFGGEFVDPEKIENSVKALCKGDDGVGDLLSQAIVVGSGKWYLSILLALNEKVVDEAATGKLEGAAKGVDPAATTVADAQKSARWTKRLTKCINDFNNAKGDKAPANSASKVYRFAILPRTPTPADGKLMTPTQKIKRRGISDEYAPIIEACGGDKELKGRTVEKCADPR
eukprot:TRINITY_DN90394_c0_g1_i1.p1 TRINITY_DN90394_c0_g1~~TRINITY_DN90394_c0_g1_i1.p1  ORF type:complete len:859 (+),score=251.02 TRINITY_DN90394_c0_g1_i1:85-2661(+)